MEKSNDIKDNSGVQTKTNIRRYIEYDGNLPERFSLQDDSKIDFTEDDVENAFTDNEIDMVDKTFLLNVLNEYIFKKDVIKKINEYRQKISEGVQPGEVKQDDAIVGNNWNQDCMKIIPKLNQRDDNAQNDSNHIEEEVSDVIIKNENSGTIYIDAMRPVDKKNEQFSNLEHTSPGSLFEDDNTGDDATEDKSPLWAESGLSNDNHAFNLSETTVDVSQNSIKVGGDLSQKNMNIKDILEQIDIQIGGELITGEEETE